jgi:chromosome segregation protein
MAEQLAKLDVEAGDLRLEAERAERDRLVAEEAMQRAREAMDALRIERAARESELAGAREAREVKARDLRTGEQELAGLRARLSSLEELHAARAEYGDGARAILAEAHADVAHLGSVADCLEVEQGFERAVEACLGDRLQYVVVPSHEQAAAGLRLAAERHAGRVGFIIAAEAPPSEAAPHTMSSRDGIRPLSAVVRATGPAAGAIAALLSRAGLAESFERARACASLVDGPVVTPEGEVFEGGWMVEGGLRAESRGILATKREIRELQERVEQQSASVEQVRGEIAAVDLTIAAADSAIASLNGELHRLEKAAVGYDMQVSAAVEAAARVRRKQEQMANERRSAEEEQRAQQARHDEACESILRIEAEQRTADDQLNRVQRLLFEAREATQAQAHRTAEAKAAHAALVERSSALASEVQRLESAIADLEARIAARRQDLERSDARRSELERTIVDSEAKLDEGLRRFDELKERVREADERSQALRTAFESEDGRIREARRALEGVRAEVAQFDVARATAEADLSHLASSCVEAVQATLDEVTAEVEQLERDGLLASPRPVDDTPEAAETEEGGEPAADAPAERAESPGARTLTPDEMVADLRAKIDRMGAVNMMAIDQFDDLESRHTFLTAQRKDLVDSIAATGEAIRRIDKTTKERFREAFTVINQNFEGTFTTLFGGGRAGLVLLDESDQLESGIDIIAQPPGKRLQSVQLLSGGEKALTAMALMFAIFKYRPSPFCLLDEIDAPLDDANIGRFVEMLQGMQDRTQFILITHNRKTMEIADRLYGVTMEEPGVSKLISVQLN